MKRPSFLLIGEAPSRTRSGLLEVRLAARAAGLPPGTALDDLPDDLRSFVRATTHANLLARYPGKEGKGAAFPLVHARARAHALVGVLNGPPSGGNLFAFGGRQFPAPAVVLLAGKRVAAAFGFRDSPHFEARRLGGLYLPLVVLPHPSGVSAWWNSSANRKRCRRYLADLGAGRVCSGFAGAPRPSPSPS